MRLIFFGPPGVGKGTFAELLSVKEKLMHINVGNILRRKIEEGTSWGSKINQFVSKGHLVPDEYVSKIVEEEIKEVNKSKTKENMSKNNNIDYKGFILDGYPRNVSQATKLIKITNVDLLIEIGLPRNILIQKLSGRRICKICSKNFNVSNIQEGTYQMPPLLPSTECKQCKGTTELLQRNDDSENVIQHRLDIYEQTYIPMMNFFKSCNYPVINFQITKGIADFDNFYEVILRKMR